MATHEDAGMMERLERVETKVDGITTKVDRLEIRFDKLETRFDGLETRFDRLETRFDGLEMKVDDLATHFVALDERLGQRIDMQARRSDIQIEHPGTRKEPMRVEYVVAPFFT